MTMAEKYCTPEMEIIELEPNDIITTSVPDLGSDVGIDAGNFDDP